MLRSQREFMKLCVRKQVVSCAAWSTRRRWGEHLQEVTSDTESTGDNQCQGVKGGITFGEPVDVLRGVLDILRSGKVVWVDLLLMVSTDQAGDASDNQAVRKRN